MVAYRKGSLRILATINLKCLFKENIYYTLLDKYDTLFRISHFPPFILLLSWLFSPKATSSKCDQPIFSSAGVSHLSVSVICLWTTDDIQSFLCQKPSRKQYIISRCWLLLIFWVIQHTSWVSVSTPSDRWSMNHRVNLSRNQNRVTSLYA